MSIQGMEVRDKILGREDDKTLEVMELIGGVYLDQGQWDIAEKLQLEVMETYKKKICTDHLDTLTSTFSLAYKWVATFQTKGLAKILASYCITAHED